MFVCVISVQRLEYTDMLLLQAKCVHHEYPVVMQMFTGEGDSLQYMYTQTFGLDFFEHL